MIPPPVFTRRFEVQLDARTAEAVEERRLATTPPRTKQEMIRHLLRLGLKTYDASEERT